VVGSAREQGEAANDMARYESMIRDGYDPWTGEQEYEYKFVGKTACDSDAKSAACIQEKQKQLTATQIGQAVCANQDVQAIAGCILDAYNGIHPEAPTPKPGQDANVLVGGNYNWAFNDGALIQGQPAELAIGRYGSIDSLHVHADGTFHVDTANWHILPLGGALHLAVDLIGGNTIWKDKGIPRP